MYHYLQDSGLSRLLQPPDQGSDLDLRVLESYIDQCTAEAQEGSLSLTWRPMSLPTSTFLSSFTVTIARAIELKHSAGIISALAYETAKLFEKTGKW